MGKNPSMIFRELYRDAKMQHRFFEAEPPAEGIDRTIYDLTVKDGVYYVPYSTAVREFLIEGYSEQKAAKHITQWVDYQLAVLSKIKGLKLLGLCEVS